LGATLCGKYRLDRLLGAGATAAVFEAADRNGHRVAVKILHPALSFSADMRRRFRREGQLANRVGHPGALRVLDDGVSEDGCAFLVMPLLQGETLKARWDRDGRCLPERDVLLAAHVLLDVLGAAHLRGVVHRDIKPENLFVTDDGDLYVLDFGIARLVETTESESATRTGSSIGTPAFMAPEQALGRRREIDGQTDLWAVGATMFTCLSGAHVHSAETGSECIIYAATRPARPLRSVLPGARPVVQAVVDRALAFRKQDRWADAREMQVAVGEAFAELFGERPREGARLPVARQRHGDRPATPITLDLQSQVARRDEDRAIALAEEKTVPATDARAGLPGQRGLQSPALFGRDVEIAAARAALARVGAGHGALLLFAGEAGIGKTALADVFAAEAGEAGMTVAWGRCWEAGGAPAYWPWTQVFRALGIADDPLGAASDASAGEARDVRFRVFDRAAETLRTVALSRPIAVVLDDLHAADVPSLLFLHLVARNVRRGGRLGILATYREAEARLASEVGAVLAKIAREGELLVPARLTQGDVASWVRTQQPAATDQTIARVHTASEGNPLFVQELLRAHTSLDASSLPDGL
jgi:hypothetical protein